MESYIQISAEITEREPEDRERERCIQDLVSFEWILEGQVIKDAVY